MSQVTGNPATRSGSSGCSIWIYDTTHFTLAKTAVTVIEDLASRKWLAEIVSMEETSV